MIKLFFQMCLIGILTITSGVFLLLIVNGEAPIGYYFGLAFNIIIAYLIFKPRNQYKSHRQLTREAKNRKRAHDLFGDR